MLPSQPPCRHHAQFPHHRSQPPLAFAACLVLSRRQVLPVPSLWVFVLLLTLPCSLRLELEGRELG